MKIILFALFTATLAQGQPVKGQKESEKPSSIPGFVRGKARPGEDRIVHVSETTDPPTNAAFVRTGEGKRDFMPMLPLAKPDPEGRGHWPDPYYPHAKVYDDIPGGNRQVGHVIHHDSDGNWNHYPANQVPPNIMSASSIQKAKSPQYGKLLEMHNAMQPYYNP